MNFQPPTCPHLADMIDHPGWDEWISSLKKYEAELAEWESSLPPKEHLIFEDKGHIDFLTPAIGGGWRITWISKIDHMPNGHDTFKTRLEALKHETNGNHLRIAAIPFEVEPLPPRANA